MDRDAVKRALTERVEQSLEQAPDAVEQAPDGQWIAASEWQVRKIFQKLLGESWQQMLQAKMDAAPQAAFSPSGPRPAQTQGAAGTSARGRQRRRARG